MQIIETAHSHTLAVELAARLLETGMLEPEALLTKLQAEKASFNTSDTVSIHKDGHSTKANYYRHIHTLFSLYQLTTAEQEVMRCLCFTPPTGISSRLLAKWLRQDSLNTINDLSRWDSCNPSRVASLPCILSCRRLVLRS